MGLNMTEHIFTSESVSEGHPDKICDRISDAVVDAYISHDPFARVAVETMVTTNRVILAGEVRSVHELSNADYEQIARNAVKDIGYEQPEKFHWNEFKFENYIHPQSSDIAMGVDQGICENMGAGDQGIMFGYASDETEAFMPAPIYYAQKIMRKMARSRKEGHLPGLGPDAKCQVSLQYQDKKPVGIHTVLISTQHEEGLEPEDIKRVLLPLLNEIFPRIWPVDPEKVFVNPTGRFVIGGPDGDAGLTGRKIIVDTYGGAAPHGGGAFSGKDPSKVDRSGAYMARYLAKNIVAAGLARSCTLQLSYGIGMSKPISIYVNTEGTGRFEDQKLASLLWDNVDLTPYGIFKALELGNPIYEKTSAYGHFGRTPKQNFFSWERLDLMDDLMSMS